MKTVKVKNIFSRYRLYRSKKNVGSSTTFGTQNLSKTTMGDSEAGHRYSWIGTVLSSVVTAGVAVLGSYLTFHASIVQTTRQFLRELEIANKQASTNMEMAEKHMVEALGIAKQQGLSALAVEDRKNNGNMISEVMKSGDQVEVAKRLRLLNQINLLPLKKQQIKELDRLIPIRENRGGIVVPGSPTVLMVFEKIAEFNRDFKGVDVWKDENEVPVEKQEQWRGAKQKLAEIQALAKYLRCTDIYNEFYSGLYYHPIAINNGHWVKPQ